MFSSRALRSPPGHVDGADGLHDQSFGAQVAAGAVHRRPAGGDVVGVAVADGVGEFVVDDDGGGWGGVGPAQTGLVGGFEGDGDRGGGLPLQGADPFAGPVDLDRAGVAQVGLAWLLAHRHNVLLIPSTSSVTHLEENLKVADLTLSDHDVAELENSV